MTRVRCNLRNPGQYLACIGIWKFASARYGPCSAHFEDGTFVLSSEQSLEAIIQDFLSCQGEPGTDGCKVTLRLTAPIQLLIDWPLRFPSSLKSWAGVQSFSDMFLRGLDILRKAHFRGSPGMFMDAIPLKSEEKGLLLLDSRNVRDPHDIGYSPDKIKGMGFFQRQGKFQLAYPIVPLLAVLGLQCARPERGTPPAFSYHSWAHPAPIELAPGIIAGLIPGFEYQKYKFDAYRLPPKRMYSVFRPAVAISSNAE